MFVRERGLTAVADKARDALGGHERFVSWHEAGGETELRAAVAWKGDPERRADLAVVLVHIPPPA